jgi:hypothetical protein
VTLPEAVTKVGITLAGASLVWLGGSVVGSARDNTRQDEKIAQLEAHQQQLDDTLKTLDSSVQSLDKNVAVLNERLQARK